MSTLKTVVNDASVEAFLKAIPDEAKRGDGLTLLELYSKITGEPAKMWGPSIVGFGQYHYKSERSSQEGDWMLTGFSPRKQNLSLYFMGGFESLQDLLKELGKYKTSTGSCLYFNKLADVDLGILEKMVRKSFVQMREKYA
jgi:hypothetical protein